MYGFMRDTRGISCSCICVVNQLMLMYIMCYVLHEKLSSRQNISGASLTHLYMATTF